MPIYVYEPVPPEKEGDAQAANDCCYFETLQWASEAPLTHCPDCGSPVRRAVTSFALASQTNQDPLRNVAKRVGDEIQAGQAGVSSSEKSEGRSLISGSASNTPAGRAARLAYKHVCSGNCRH
ncbi:MAG: FmdB family zinc ribbon protein [Silvanigrellaceae bacterium]